MAYEAILPEYALAVGTHAHPPTTNTCIQPAMHKADRHAEHSHKQDWRPHPAPLSGWAGWRSASGNICTGWIHLAGGLRYSLKPAVAPGSQCPQLLPLGHRNPWACRPTPAAAPDTRLLSSSEPPRPCGPRTYSPSDSRDYPSLFHSQVLLWSHPWKHRHLPCSQSYLHILVHSCSKSSLYKALHAPTCTPSLAPWAHGHLIPSQGLVLAFIWVFPDVVPRHMSPLCRTWIGKSTDYLRFIPCQLSYHFIPLFSQALTPWIF